MNSTGHVEGTTLQGVIVLAGRTKQPPGLLDGLFQDCLGWTKREH